LIIQIISQSDFPNLLSRHLPVTKLDE